MAYKDSERADYEAKERLKIERETAKEKLRIERMQQKEKIRNEHLQRKEKLRSEHLQQKEKARKEAEERQQFRKEYSKSSGIKQPAPQKHSKNTFELTNKKNRAIAFFLCLFLPPGRKQYLPEWRWKM